MSLGTCLADLRGRGVISEERAAELEGRYDELVQQYEGRFGRTAAESMASQKVLDMADLDAMHRKRQALLQAKHQGEWQQRMKLAADEDGVYSGRAATDELVAMDGHRKSIRKQALGMVEAMLAKHRRNLLGEVREKSELNDVVDELFGKGSGSANAREIADAWKQTAEWLRSRFNAAGGTIGKLDSWALPQRHDMSRVREAGFEAWRDSVVPLLDRAKMIDRDTGEAMSDAKLELMLDDMWHAIATDGWTRNSPGGIRGSAVANRRSQHRVLHFRDGDAWRAYADQFGSGNAFDAMMGHIEAMSRDIAAMERMGPNPAATLRFQQDAMRQSTELAMRTGKAGAKATDRASSGVETLQELFDTYSGDAQRPVNRRLALGFSAFRAQQVAAKLGGAFLSVGGDFGTMALTAGFDGLPVGKVFARYGRLMNPANMEDRRLAARLGIISDEWASASAGQYRFTGEEIAHETSRRLAEGVLRASGLTLHTEAAQMAFGMEMVSAITQASDRSFAQLDGSFRTMLQRYGFDEARWDQLRATPKREQRGADWIFPEDIADQSLADDMVRMMVTEADHAVPMPDLRTQAMVNSRLRPGTWRGEIARSVFLFKGFPLSILNLHGRRMMELAGANRVKYGLALMTLTTVGGALSLQAKELAKGRDPQQMDSSRFWAAAGLQGGGLGIFGDLLASSENRFGGGVAGTLAGPGAQLFDNSVGATVRNATAMFDGDADTESQWGKDAVKLLSSETPGLSLWYARLAIDRTLKDMLTEWADPGAAAKSYRRMERYAAEQGTAYWAPPGQGLRGMRAPDLDNALGEDEVALLE